jgi:hypothetical protein
MKAGGTNRSPRAAVSECFCRGFGYFFGQLHHSDLPVRLWLKDGSRADESCLQPLLGEGNLKFLGMESGSLKSRWPILSLRFETFSLSTLYSGRLIGFRALLSLFCFVNPCETDTSSGLSIPSLFNNNFQESDILER